MTGLPTVGGWNKGLRYGEQITPEDLKAEPVRLKGVGCTCGGCYKCTNRVYQRVWARKRAANPKPFRSDEELDANAQRWLETHR